MSEERLYRVSFVNQDKVYEVFARQVYEADLYGFLAVEEFVFNTHSDLLIDPSEERLKSEFNSVKRTFVPMYSIIRIDEVEKPGVSKIKDMPSNAGGNVSPFTPRPKSDK